MNKILIVEDEENLRKPLEEYLKKEGFSILTATSLQEAETKIAESPALVLLDWMLPGINGLTYAKKLKTEKSTQHIPIIMITARAEEESKLRGLETGADDYVTKPLSPRELIARIKAVLRRGPLISPNNLIHVGTLILDTQQNKLSVNNQDVPLSLLEYKLLYFLVSHKNHICSREKILDHVWDRDSDVELRTVDVQIRRLRDKLKSHGADKYIQTKQGLGYVFKSPTT